MQGDVRDARAAITGYVRERLHAEQRAHGRGYQARVARAAGLSSAHVANVMTEEHRGVGIEAAAKLAGYWGMSLDQLTATALEWASRTPPSARVSPNLMAALDYLRARGELTEAAERAASVAPGTARSRG